MNNFNESQVLREKAGQPTGGQFAEKEKGASGLALTPAPATADEAGTRLEEAMRALNDSQQWPLSTRGEQLWVRAALTGFCRAAQAPGFSRGVSRVMTGLRGVSAGGPHTWVS